jgi:hypothetical protein
VTPDNSSIQAKSFWQIGVSESLDQITKLQYGIQLLGESDLGRLLGALPWRALTVGRSEC